MNISEFKMWLEGFTHAINVVPTHTQWDLILKKMKEIQEYPAVTVCNCNKLIPRLSPWPSQIWCSSANTVLGAS